MSPLQPYIEKAATLVEALPYIQSFRGKTVVVKYGGSTMNGVDDDTVLKDLVFMESVGINPVIVHGRHHPGVAFPLDLVADHRVAAELSAEEGSQGLVAHVFGHGKAIKLAYLSQCRVTFKNEVTKEAAAFQSAWRLRLAEQLGQCRQVARATYHAEHIVQGKLGHRCLY
mgnify:CR=1 FL=1